MSEKLKYLKVATPEQWDWWLTLKADDLAPSRKGHKINWATRILMDMESPSCLFCRVFERDCASCMPGGKFLNCITDVPGRLRVDAAIERLEKVGVWDD